MKKEKKAGKGKKNQAQVNNKTGGKSRGFGSIAEQPIETHRIDTPPRTAWSKEVKQESIIA